MFKKVALICALVALVAYPAYAEVQNIKVSGDITAMGVYRNNYDLEGKYWTEGTSAPDGYANSEDQDSFLMSIVRLRVDADLTDNVATCVRLANLREWDNVTDVDGYEYEGINIDLANITLKEMLYSPLTVIIGRQELMYGNGLIVGYGLFQDPGNNLRYGDLSSMHGYDSVRAILDYDPWILNLTYAKMSEADDVSATNRDSDIDLYGANLGYKFANYDAEVEGYVFYKRDENYGLRTYLNNVLQQTFDHNQVWTGGARASLVPYENLTLQAELAGQWGTIRDSDSFHPDITWDGNRDRSAMAANVGGKYAFANVRFAPTLGVEYLYLSGEEVDEDNSAVGEYQDKSDFDAWDPMYRGKIMGTIRDTLENLYATNDSADTSGWTNQQTIKVNGSLNLGELVDGLSLDMAYLHYWFDEPPAYGEAEDEIGDELALKLTYDYTEDVQFALNNAMFIPGDYYETAHANQVLTNGGMTLTNTAAINRPINDVAVSVIGSCKVTF